MINFFPILLLFPEYLFTLRETPFEETDSKKYKVNLSIIPSPRNLSKKEKPYNFHISPNSIPITIHDSCPLSFENIFHQSQRNFQTRKPIPGHEEAKSRLTGALDGARARPRNAKSLSLSLQKESKASVRGRRALERERDRALPSRTRLFVICQGVCLRSRCPDVDTVSPIIAMAACFLGRGEGKNRRCTRREGNRERERRRKGRKGEQRARENEWRKLVAAC